MENYIVSYWVDGENYAFTCQADNTQLEEMQSALEGAIENKMWERTCV